MRFFIFRDLKRNGASLNEPEAKHQRCAAFDAALALRPEGPR
jgi:hypothetical protein